MDVTYVDENDKEIGSGSISNAIDNGIAVRIARVFIFNSQGDLLLQKRSDTHKSLPGRWDHSAAGHVDTGESYEQAAVRELSEEVGIKNIELTKIGKFYGVETDEIKPKKRFNMLFVGSYNGEIKIDKDEVSDYQWLGIDELLDQIESNPDNFAQGFLNALNFYLEKSIE